MFELGNLTTTLGASEIISEIDMQKAIIRHQTGDWGNVCEEDWKENDYSVKNGLRILSSYISSSGIDFWIMTDADRSSTIILLPSEY